MTCKVSFYFVLCVLVFYTLGMLTLRGLLVIDEDAWKGKEAQGQHNPNIQHNPRDVMMPGVRTTG